MVYQVRGHLLVGVVNEATGRQAGRQAGGSNERRQCPKLTDDHWSEQAGTHESAE